MSEGFSYETAIKDGMSGPAHHEVEALGELEHAIGKTDKAIQGLGHAHSKFGHLALEAKGFLKEFTGSLVPEIAAGELAAEGVKKVFEGVIDIAKEGVEFALEAAEFRENMSIAFEVVEGTAEAGEDAYRAVERAAVANHGSIKDSEALANELALSGIKNVETLTAAVTAATDLQRVGLGAGQERLRRIIEQSQALGKLHVETRSLAGLGLQLDDLAKTLATKLPGTPEEIKKQLLAGKIAADVGIEAILESINSGKIGQAAAKKFDLTDVETDWHNVWTKLVEDVDAGPLTSALRGFVQIFDDGSASGRVFKDEITSDINWVIGILGGFIDHATNFALKTELAFVEAKYALTPLRAELDKLGITEAVVHGLGVAVGFVAHNMFHLADSTARVIHLLSEVGAVGGHVGGIGSGESFVTGLVNSLYAGIPGIHAAGHAAGAAAHDGAKEALDAHSPSRKAYELGIDYGEGFAMGGEASRERVARAMGDLVMPDMPAPANSNGGGGGGSRSVTVEAGAVVIHIEGGAAVEREEIKEIVEDALADAIDRVNLELGG